MTETKKGAAEATPIQFKDPTEKYIIKNTTYKRLLLPNTIRKNRIIKLKHNKMNIDLNQLIETIKGYGTDSQPLTIGLLKAILLEIKSKNEK